ncbi:MAG: LPS export ABC transporter ATP-binding protein [Candidatus Zixiibacteriota bacterium]
MEDIKDKAQKNTNIAQIAEHIKKEKTRTTLETDGLVKIYRKKRAVNGISISVQQGEIVGLLGPNGAGKTTTFFMIVGLIKPNDGKVIFSGNDITKMPMYKRAKLGIGYLPQEASVFRKLTVQENIMAILETLPINKKERKKRLEKLLDSLNISHLADQKAYTLSGGERRRVEITRALVTEPKFLLLDEPFAGIDPIVVSDLQKIIGDLKKLGLGILITDHNVYEVLTIVDRAYIVYEGNVLISGNSEYLLNNKKAREIYLGEEFRLS